MMNLTIRLKSAALVVAMVTCASTIGSEAASTGSCMSTVMSFMPGNRVVAVGATLSAIALIAAKIRLNTKPRVEYSAADFDTDVKNLLAAYNIFDAESRATIMAFIDKYIVGAEFKREETTTRTKNEDGSIFTIKGNKVTQKPFGLMGLLDAYVLQQMKKTTQLVPVAAGFYVLVNDPYCVWSKAVVKAQQ